MSRILSRISMFTGQISSHALHEVQAHTSSEVMRSKRLLAADGDLGVDADRRRHRRRAGAGHDLAGLEHDLARVERLAGGVGRAHRRAAAAHRAGVGVEQLLPGEVLDRGGAEALELGLHEVRHRLHGALGALAVAQVHVQRRREDVAQHRDRQDRHEQEEAGDVGDPPDLVDAGQVAVLVDQRRRAGSRRTTTPRTPGRPSQGDAPHLGAEAGDGDGEERAEDEGVLGLGLDADAVGPLHVAADDRPQHADEEHEPGAVADGRVALVHVAVQELGRLRQLVVDLEHRGDGEQDQEREVDEAVHDPGGGIAQQRLHVDAGPEVLEAAADVLGGGRAVVGRAPLPVAHPLAEQHRPVEDRGPGAPCRRRASTRSGCSRTPRAARRCRRATGRAVAVIPETSDDRGEHRAERDRQLVGLDAVHGCERSGSGPDGPEPGSAVGLASSSRTLRGQRLAAACGRSTGPRRRCAANSRTPMTSTRQVGVGDHRRGARPVVEQRQLADAGARARGGHLLLVAADLGGAARR